MGLMDKLLDNNELKAWLRLGLEPNLSAAKTRLLLSVFGLPQNIYNAATSSLAAYIEPQLATRMRQAPDEQLELAIKKALDWLNKPNHHLISLADEHYPKSLLDLDDAPITLYAQGQLETLKRPCIAIVGARSATPQGLENASAFARYLAAQGWCIVSGLANGIDGAAHSGALAAKQPAASTLAILGSGLNNIYPTNHQQLAAEISKNGLLISEFPLDMPAIPRNFPIRNRLVAAITKGTIVVEAALRSGSLITARLAGELGREVYAIPGSIHSPLSRGCHKLIKQGAKLVESGEDIIEEIGQQLSLDLDVVKPLKTKQNVKSNNFKSSTNMQSALAPDLESVAAESVLKALGYEASSLEDLQKRLSWPLDKLLGELTLLELAGLISKQADGTYLKNG